MHHFCWMFIKIKRLCEYFLFTKKTTHEQSKNDKVRNHCCKKNTKQRKNNTEKEIIINKNDQLVGKSIKIDNNYVTAGDVNNDIITLKYLLNGEIEHFICLSLSCKLTTAEALKQINTNNYNKPQQKLLLDYPVINAKLNDCIDLTQRIKSYIGDKGCHFEIYEKQTNNYLKIRWFLTKKEISQFKKLYILTKKCIENEYYDVDDKIRSTDIM